jgi:PIN domain nuclease of toxin-antitoxin system
VSTASFWEIATKYRLGKLPSAEVLLQDAAEYLEREDFELLELSLTVAIRAGVLPGPHRDPFDRMLVAQALESDLLIVSRDAALDGFGARRVW